MAANLFSNPELNGLKIKFSADVGNIGRKTYQYSVFQISFLLNVMSESMRRIHCNCKFLFIRDGDVIECGN